MGLTKLGNSRLRLPRHAWRSRNVHGGCCAAASLHSCAGFSATCRLRRNQALTAKSRRATYCAFLPLRAIAARLRRWMWLAQSVCDGALAQGRAWRSIALTWVAKLQAVRLPSVMCSIVDCAQLGGGLWPKGQPGPQPPLGSRLSSNNNKKHKMKHEIVSLVAVSGCGPRAQSTPWLSRVRPGSSHGLSH